MEELNNRVSDARRRIAALVMVARLVWVVNSLVGLASFVLHRYEVAALAGYTALMSLFLTACARRAVRHLHTVERVISSS